MEIPILTWEICFLFDWCYQCNKVVEMRNIPTIHPKVITKNCKSCDTLYMLNVDDTFRTEHRVIAPDHFQLPTFDLIEQFKKRFN